MTAAGGGGFKKFFAKPGILHPTQKLAQHYSSKFCSTGHYSASLCNALCNYHINRIKKAKCLWPMLHETYGLHLDSTPDQKELNS